MRELFGGKDFGVESTESPWWVTRSSSHQIKTEGTESLGLQVSAIDLRSYYMLLEHCEKESVCFPFTHAELLVRVPTRLWFCLCSGQRAEAGYSIPGLSSTLGSWLGKRKRIWDTLCWLRFSFTIHRGDGWLSGAARAVTSNIDEWTVTPFILRCLVTWVLVQNRPSALVLESQGLGGGPGGHSPPTCHKHGCIQS